MSETVNLKRETFLQFTGRATMAVLGFVTLVAMSHLRGVSVVGTYYFGLTLAFLASRAAGGLGSALRKRVSELDAEPDALYTLALAIHLGVAAAISAVVFVVYTLSPFDLPPVKFAGATLLASASLGLFYLTMDTYSGKGQPGRALWFDVARSGLQFVIFLPLLFSGVKAPTLLAAGSVSSVVLTVAIIYDASLWFKLPDYEVARRFIKFARWSVPTAFVTNAYVKYDVVLLGIIMTSSAVGFYESAMRLALPARFIASSIHNVISVKTSQHESRGDLTNSGILDAMNVVGVIAFPLFWGALATGDVLLPVAFGPDFAAADALIALVGVMLFRMFTVFVVPFQGFFQGLDMPEIVFKTQLGGLLVNIPISAVLTYHHGIIGVVIGTLVVEAGMVIRYQLAHKRIFGDLVVSREIGLQFLCGGVMWGIVTAVRRFVPGSFESVIGVGVLVGIGAVVYGCCLLTASPTVRDLVVPPMKQRLNWV